MDTKTKCPQCSGEHSLSQCPNWRVPAGFRVLSVALAPEIKDAIRECGVLYPQTIWAAIIARHDLVHQPDQQQASTAQEQAASVPAGWQIVPVEPTEAMLRASVSYREVDADDEISHPIANVNDRVYRAMLAAAPPAAESHAVTDAEIDEACADVLPRGLNHKEYDRAIVRAALAHLARKG